MALWALVPVALALAAIIIVILSGALVDDEDSRGSLQATAAPPANTTTAGPSSPAAEACATAASSSDGPTVFETLTEDASHPGDFDPSFGIQVGDSSAGATSDLSFEMALRQGDVHFLAFYINIPDEWGITPGCAIPLGETVGTLRWLTTLGIVNGPCRDVFTLEFTMQNASADPSDTIEFVDDTGNLIADVDEDKDGSGLADVIEKYPDQLTDLFAGRAPVRRAVGIANVARTSLIVQSLVFPPVESAAAQTLFILFQDFANVRTSVGRTPFTDQCTSFSLALTELGISGSGEVLIKNPPAGTYTFALTALGLRDADDDGIENALDTCPFDVNVGGARLTGDGDADQDGLDAACDPNDFAFDSDQDGDEHLNRGDLCPLSANPDRSGTQKDKDVDQIGDECDLFGNGPDVPDGAVFFAAEAFDAVIR